MRRKGKEEVHCDNSHVNTETEKVTAEENFPQLKHRPVIVNFCASLFDPIDWLLKLMKSLTWLEKDDRGGGVGSEGIKVKTVLLSNAYSQAPPRNQVKRRGESPAHHHPRMPLIKAAPECAVCM